MDLGCGDGVVTQQLVAAGCSVVGVDASPELLESAAGLGLDARLMDGHELTFDGEFDAVFSHAALHWMKKDPSAVLRVRCCTCSENATNDQECRLTYMVGNLIRQLRLTNHMRPA